MLLSQKQLSIIAKHEPTTRPDESLMEAAISIILRDGRHGTEFLLMQRAHHDNDPWSGQMAFPGGKVELTDATKKATAIRETHEEVGVLLKDQDYIGQLDDFYGWKVSNKYNVHVSCFVFKLDEYVNLQGNHEVADLVWLPMSFLDNPKHAHDFYHPKDSTMQMPAVLIDKDKQQILWGLSLRMLMTLYELVDSPMRVLQNQKTDLLINN